MTDKNLKYWKRSEGVYQQPNVLNPPINQNANNSRHSIWHLGRVFEIEVYPTQQSWQVGAGTNDDGRHNKEDPRILEVYGTIQPERKIGGSSRLISEPFGERSEGRIVVHIDSHQPENILVADQNIDIFPNGIRLIGPDDEGVDDRFNFTTVIRFRSRRWKVIELMELFESGDEDLDDEGAVYRAVCHELKDASHERNATREVSENNNERFWGGDY